MTNIPIYSWSISFWISSRLRSSLLMVVSGCGNLATAEAKATPILLLPTSKASRLLLTRTIIRLLFLNDDGYLGRILWRFSYPERTVIYGHVFDIWHLADHYFDVT